MSGIATKGDYMDMSNGHTDGHEDPQSQSGSGKQGDTREGIPEDMRMMMDRIAIMQEFLPSELGAEMDRSEWQLVADVIRCALDGEPYEFFSFTDDRERLNEIWQELYERLWPREPHEYLRKLPRFRKD
jgi:hypothetical protein